MADNLPARHCAGPDYRRELYGPPRSARAALAAHMPHMPCTPPPGDVDDEHR
jgi:hypothetical protein